MQARLILLTAALLLCCITNVVTAQEESCDWGDPPPGCTDSWTPFQTDVWIVLYGPPNCMVKVRVYGNMRCNQIEWLDMSFKTTPDQYIPYACGTVDQTTNFVFGNSYDFRNQIYNQVVLLVQNSWLTANGGLNSCCPCPSQELVVEAKTAACANLMLTFQVPNSSPVVMRYDTQHNWSWYQSYMQTLGGFDPVISIEQCFGYACCYRERTFCVEDQSTINYVDGPWQALGDCDEASEPCDIIYCEP